MHIAKVKCEVLQWLKGRAELSWALVTGVRGGESCILMAYDSSFQRWTYTMFCTEIYEQSPQGAASG